MSSLKQKSISGVKWNALMQISLQVMLLSTSLILSRFFILPDDYGLMGMILVFTGFANVLKDFGIGSAIVQKKELSDDDLSTAFLFNISLGIGLTLLFILASPLIAMFYNEPRISLITKIVALNFTLSSFNIVQQALLERELNFKAIFTYNFIAYLSSSLAALAMAMAHWGVWVLVLQPIILSLVLNLCFWTQSKWRPILVFSKEAFNKLLRFSSYLLGSTAINYWALSVDNMIIGKYSGAHALGIYTRAYTLMFMPITQITSTLVKVLMPAISRIQDDKEKVGNVYLRSLALIAVVNFPVIIGLIVTADSLILLILGENWRECILIYRILAVVSILRVVVSPIGMLMIGLGETKLLFRFTIVVCSVSILLIFLGFAAYGVIGVACSLIISSTFYIIYAVHIVAKVIPLTYLLFFKSVIPPFLAALIMGIISYAVGNLLIPKDLLLVRLLVEVVVGLLSYTAWIHIFQLSAYKEFVEVAGLKKYLPFLK